MTAATTLRLAVPQEAVRPLAEALEARLEALAQGRTVEAASRSERHQLAKLLADLRTLDAAGARLAREAGL